MYSPFLADAVLIAHVMYVSIVIFSVPLILAGWWRRWNWVRNAWFRLGHLLMILIVVGESFLGIHCPLTVWEDALRRHASDTGQNQTDFISRLLDHVLFYHFPAWEFTVAYTTFAIIVAALFVLVPLGVGKAPRRPRGLH